MTNAEPNNKDLSSLMDRLGLDASEFDLDLSEFSLLERTNKQTNFLLLTKLPHCSPKGTDSRPAEVVSTTGNYLTNLDGRERSHGDSVGGAEE